MPPEAISLQNIRRAACRAGEVLEVDWKDSITLKWLSVPKALVKAKIGLPLATRISMKSSTGKKLKIYFKYEKLSTFCYDCEIIRHKQGNCKAEGTVVPSKYGPWLRYDESADILLPDLDQPE